MKNDEFILHAGLIQDLEAAFRRNGLSRKDVKELSKGKVLDSIRALVRGNAKIEMINHVINCSADPDISRVPGDWGVNEHRRTGDFVWDPSKVSLNLFGSQEGARVINAYTLPRELRDKPNVNANVLDYLLSHQELIPENWKGKRIFFCGTIYSDGGLLYVRYLYWGEQNWFSQDQNWFSQDHWLGNGCSSDDAAATFASV